MYVELSERDRTELRAVVGSGSHDMHDVDPTSAATMGSMSSATIYVQIPAYRDSELSRTLRGLYRHAAHPERLRTKVIWQRAADDSMDNDVRALPNLELVEIPAEKSLGCNWARRLAQQDWAGEPFTLLLDSHHRFVDGWDTLLTGMYSQLLGAGVPKPLLTAYLPPYDPSIDPLGRGTAPYKIYPLSRDQGVLTRLTSHPIPWWQTLNRPLPAEFLSLHLVFAAGAFNEEVPFEPNVYFFGDEVVTGLRAFTAGYDFFHPHRIVGWHSYSRAGRVLHWDDHPDWYQRHLFSLDLMRELFTSRGAHALLGGARTVTDYEELIMMPLVST